MRRPRRCGLPQKEDLLCQGASLPGRLGQKPEGGKAKSDSRCVHSHSKTSQDSCHPTESPCKTCRRVLVDLALVAIP